MFPDVCGCGNGDILEEQTLQDLGKFKHCVLNAPLVKNTRNLSFSCVGVNDPFE